MTSVNNARKNNDVKERESMMSQKRGGRNCAVTRQTRVQQRSINCLLWNKPASALVFDEQTREGHVLRSTLASSVASGTVRREKQRKTPRSAQKAFAHAQTPTGGQESFISGCAEAAAALLSALNEQTTRPVLMNDVRAYDSTSKHDRHHVTSLTSDGVHDLLR